MRPWVKTSCDNYFCTTYNRGNPEAVYHLVQPSNTAFKGQAFLWSQNAGIIYLTCSCTPKYSQDLQEHSSQLQLSEVIPMLCQPAPQITSWVRLLLWIRHRQAPMISDNVTGLAAPSGTLFNIFQHQMLIIQRNIYQYTLFYKSLICVLLLVSLGQWGHGVLKTSCDNFFCITCNRGNPEAAYHLPQPSNTTFKGQAFLWSHNAGIIFLTCSCTPKYLQGLEEHNRQLQHSEVIPMLY